MMLLQKQVVGMMLTCMWLFSLAAGQPPSPDNDAGTPILDTDGQSLVPDAQYYIKPAIPGRGGALTLVTRKGKACPDYVGQVESPDLQGTPIKFIFSPSIIEGRRIAIQFQASTSCLASPRWSLTFDREPVTGRRLIGTDNKFSFGSEFKIVNNNGLYHIVWCTTTISDSETTRCGTAGILAEDGVRLLVLDGPELPFVFEKVQ